MEAKLERGSASLFIEQNNGALKVYHGTDKVLLYSSEVYEGYWDNLWEAIKNNNLTK